MSAIILPGRFNKQPQYAAPLDKRHWLTKDVTVAITGATPGFNAATSQPLSITSGGSGYSRRLTPHGWSLYTPNGGWASLALGVDWQGPNTVFALCRVIDIDNPWGGLFNKFSTGTSSQFGVGRRTSNDELYGAVNDTTQAIPGSTVSGLALGSSGFTVLTFTHDGSSTSGMSFYRNGILIGTTAALGVQNSGAGNLIIGASRDQSASFDSDADWMGFVRAKRVLSVGEVAEVSRSMWSLWQAPQKRLWTVSAVTTITGTVTYTNIDDTVSASGTTTVTGSVAATNANDTSTATGTTTVTGSSATANANDTVSASGSPVIVGTSATTNADDAVSASGAVGSAVSGSVAYTNVDDTATASGTTTVTGSAAVTNVDDTASATGTTTVAGTSATTNANDVCAASGEVSADEVTGTVAYTNANDTAAASGTTTIVGLSSTTNTNDTVLAFGVVNAGIVVETALTTGITQADRIKKPGIPTGTADWLKTFLEIIVGRRGNKIAVPAAQDLTFSATPTQAECEALHAYTNEVREAVNKIITRLDS